MSMEDAAHILSEFLYSIENVPHETSFLLEEIGHIDSTIQETRHAIAKRDVGNIQKHIKAHGLLNENPKEGQLVTKIRSDYARLSKLSDEKVSLAERGVKMLDKHVRKLQSEFERLKELGYDIGDVDPTPVTATSAGMGTPGMGGFPQLDMSSSSTTGSHKKRKLAPVNTSMGFQGQGHPGMPSTAQMQAYQNNLYAQQQMHHGTPTQSNMPGMYQMQPTQSPVHSSNPYAANMGQYNQGPLSAQQQQQQQQHNLAQSYQNAYSTAGPIQNGGAASGSGGGAGNNASRPHRPSRLSSSFSAMAGPGQQMQILPTSTSAHLPPAMHSPSLAASTSSQPSNLSASVSGPGNKRARANGPQSAGVPKKKQKKRIQISDEESIADEAMSVDDVDAEGEEEEGADGAEGIVNVVSSNAVGNARGRIAGTAAQQKAASRAGTPTSNGPTAASSGIQNGNAGPRIKNVGGNRQSRALQQQQAQAQAKKKDDEDGEGEEEDADAEGEEDWGQEVDETNADDPTLYCLCQRVSYGNMIACDNPECKFEWFHWACVRVSKQPDDDQTWYCPECLAEMMKPPESTEKVKGAPTSSGSAPKAILSNSSGGGNAYAQLAAQQREMMLAAQQSRDAGNSGGAAGAGTGAGGRASRRG